MKRALLVVLMIIFAGTLFGGESEAQDIQLNIPSTLSGETETKIDLVIGVSFSGREISNFDMRLSYNPSIISIDVDDVRLGNSVAGSFSWNVTSDHRILLAFASSSAIPSTDTLVVISGTLLAPGDDAKGITIKNWNLGDGTASVNLTAPVDIRVVSQQSTSTESESEAPLEFGIRSIYPNPFNPSSIIRYYMEMTGPVKIEVVDSRGRVIRQLLDTYRQAGEHEVPVDGTDLSSGVYFVRIVTEQGVRVRPFSLIK